MMVHVSIISGGHLHHDGAFFVVSVLVFRWKFRRNSTAFKPRRAPRERPRHFAGVSLKVS